MADPCSETPRALWSRWLTPDERHRVPLACRTLLVREPHRNILLETGIGGFLSTQAARPVRRQRVASCVARRPRGTRPHARGHRHRDSEPPALDHAGGLLSAFDDANEPTLLFPNAQFVVSDLGWERAQQPHARDRASFLQTSTASWRPAGDSSSSIPPPRPDRMRRPR